MTDATALDDVLRRTLDDGRLSRAERGALGAVLDELPPGRFAWLRSRVFAIARDALATRDPGAIVAWCEAVVQLAADREASRLQAQRTVTQEAWFSPDDACAPRIVAALDAARSSIDACVFTLTDDRITAALAAAHRRGVALRLITDDAKAGDLGSDVDALAAQGVPVRTDRTPAHMHHKFALVDRRTLLTGSYNWTRSASRDNEENLVVSDDPVLVARFGAQFERLWARFGG